MIEVRLIFNERGGWKVDPPECVVFRDEIQGEPGCTFTIRAPEPLIPSCSEQSTLRAVRDALRDLPRGDTMANYFVDHIVAGFFGEGGRFEVKEEEPFSSTE